MAEDAPAQKHQPGAVSLEGRTAFVTGASSGLGFGIARAIAGAGGRVIVAARRRERLDELVSEIERKGGEALAVECDVGDEASIVRAFDAATDRFGRIDTIVANAGINRDGSATTMSAADFDAIISVNLRGVFLTAREGARRLIDHPAPDAPNGRVLLIGSIAGLRILPGLTAYGVSKAGVNTLTMYVATSHGKQGVRVNTIVPGLIITDAVRAHLTERMLAGLGRATLTPYVGQPEDVAHLVVFLASDESRYITGQMIAIDGGMTAHVGAVGQDDK